MRRIIGSSWLERWSNLDQCWQSKAVAELALVTTSASASEKAGKCWADPSCRETHTRCRLGKGFFGVCGKGPSRIVSNRCGEAAQMRPLSISSSSLVSTQSASLLATVSSLSIAFHQHRRQTTFIFLLSSLHRQSSAEPHHSRDQDPTVATRNARKSSSSPQQPTKSNQPHPRTRRAYP
jgi:hypothetical protein